MLTAFHSEAIAHRGNSPVIIKEPARRCLGNLRTSQTHLWLSERFELTTTITGMLVACRKSLTKRSDCSESPEGPALKPPSTVAAHLKRTSHSLRTLSCIRRLYRPAETVSDLFAGSQIQLAPRNQSFRNNCTVVCQFRPFRKNDPSSSSRAFRQPDPASAIASHPEMSVWGLQQRYQTSLPNH